MSLGEPAPMQGDLNFSLFGIPVRVQPAFWLIGALMGMGLGELPTVLVWIVAFFIGILCHEMGHALVMRAYGFHPWITLYGLGGMASYDYSQAARAGRWTTLRQIVISAAGPAAGFLLAALVVAALTLSGHDVIVEVGAPLGLFAGTPDKLFGRWPATYFVNDLLFVTVVYGIFNLLPVYPLDGGKIAREALVAVSPRGGVRVSLVLSILVAVVLAVFAAARYQWFAALLFGYLAYGNYTALQFYTGQRWR